MKQMVIALLAMMISFAGYAQKLRPSDVPQEVRLGLENNIV